MRFMLIASKQKTQFILKNRKRPIAKRLLENDVFEHLCVSARVMKEDSLVSVLIMRN